MAAVLAGFRDGVELESAAEIWVTAVIGGIDGIDGIDGIGVLRGSAGRAGAALWSSGRAVLPRFGAVTIPVAVFAGI